MFDIVQRALRPLTPYDFFAFFHNAWRENLKELDFSPMASHDQSKLDRLLKSRSGGCLSSNLSLNVNKTQSKIYPKRLEKLVVQFTHQTVKSFTADQSVGRFLSQTKAADTCGYEHFLNHFCHVLLL